MGAQLAASLGQEMPAASQGAIMHSSAWLSQCFPPFTCLPQTSAAVSTRSEPRCLVFCLCGKLGRRKK